MTIFKSKNIFQWGPIDGAPLTIHYSALPGMREMKRDFGLAWPKTVLAYKGDKMAWFNDNDALTSMGVKVVKKFIINKAKKNKILKEWEYRIKTLHKTGREIFQTNLKGLTNEELVNLFQKFDKIFSHYWSYAMLAEPVNFGAEELLRRKLLKIPKQFRDEVLVILAAPTKPSFYAEEELALLNIEKKFKQPKGPLFEKEIKKHWQKYDWMLDNYLRPKPLKKEYFVDLIKKHKKQRLNPVKKQQEILYHLQFAKQQKLKAIKKHKLDKETILYADLVDEFMLFQDERKKNTLKGNRYLDEILKEVGRRRKVRWLVLRYLLPNELVEFINGKNFSKEISKRKKIAVVEYLVGNRYGFLSQEKARQYHKELFRVEVNSKVTEFSGTVASRGYARGKVNILYTARQVNKMRQGDILVTTMTTPDFIVALKKAAALVTDIGGLTCHAAIVSRELKIPCIIGTKIATKVLKDGDKVVVDANNGIIKKLK